MKRSLAKESIDEAKQHAQLTCAEIAEHVGKYGAWVIATLNRTRDVVISEQTSLDDLAKPNAEKGHSP